MCTSGNRDHAYGTHVSMVRHSGLLCAVANLGESIVDFVVWPWVIDSDYWDVKFDFTKAVKEAFDTEGISTSFPQRDLHVFRAAPVYLMLRSITLRRS